MIKILIHIPFIIALITGLIVFPMAFVGLLKEMIIKWHYPLSPRKLDTILEFIYDCWMLLLFLGMEILFICMAIMLVLNWTGDI